MKLIGINRWITLLIFVTNIAFAYAENKHQATIIPYDAITSPGIEVWPQAKVITKKFYAVEMPVGGERIEFHEGDRYLGLALTGGDGVGAVRYTPYRKGIQRIKVRLPTTSAYEAEEAELLIGVWDRSRSILIISMDALMERSKEVSFPFFSKKKKDSERNPRARSLEVVSDLSKRFNIVYLYRGDLSFLHDKRSWLYRAEFPVYPLLIWDDGMVPINKLISERRKDIKGVIVTEEDEVRQLEKEGIRQFILVEKKRQSEYLRKFKDTTVVMSWEEIGKALSR